VDNAYACAEGADALVIVTEWEQFRALDVARLKQIMARSVVVDLRNVYRPDDMAKYGFTYVGVGTVGIQNVSEPHSQRVPRPPRRTKIGG
jgi:UDPglucose 6-dehydrogenase